MEITTRNLKLLNYHSSTIYTSLAIDELVVALRTIIAVNESWMARNFMPERSFRGRPFNGMLTHERFYGRWYEYVPIRSFVRLRAVFAAGADGTIVHIRSGSTVRAILPAILLLWILASLIWVRIAGQPSDPEQIFVVLLTIMVIMLSRVFSLRHRRYRAAVTAIGDVIAAYEPICANETIGDRQISRHARIAGASAQ